MLLVSFQVNIQRPPHHQFGTTAARESTCTELGILRVCFLWVQEQSGKRQEAERRLVAEQIEAERRTTEKYKSELEGKVQRERALAEAEGRAREKRENEDVDRRYSSCEISRLACCQNERY